MRAKKEWKKVVALLFSFLMLFSVVSVQAETGGNVAAPRTKEEQIKEDFLEELKTLHLNESAYQELTADDVELYKFYKISEDRIIFSACLKGWVGATVVEEVEIGDCVFVFPGGGAYYFLYWENGNIFSVNNAYETGALTKEEIHEYYVARGNMPTQRTVFFNDVNWLEDWFADYVYTLCSKNVMVGLNETTFGPYETVIRAQFAVILERMAMPEESSLNAPPFEDVDENAWYFEAVSWAYEMGIISGYGNELFGPADAITREQMAVMLYRYAQYKGYVITDTEAQLTDFIDGNSVSAFAETAMKWCVANDIISGNNGKLSPQEYTTRAECAAMICRFLEVFA